MNAQDPETFTRASKEVPVPGPDAMLYSVEKENLEAGVRDALNQLEQETLGTPVEKMTPGDVAEAADRMRQGEINYLERQTHSQDKDVAARAEFILSIKEKMDALIDEVHAMVRRGDDDEAHAQVKGFLIETRNDLEQREVKGEDIDRAITQMQLLIDLDVALIASTEATKSALLTLTSFGMDLVPFVGGLKMVTESAAGKTLDGENLEGMRRLAHGAEGLLWEVVDVASVAAALVSAGTGGAALEGVARGAKVATAAPRLSKVLTRSGAFMRKHGIEGSKEVFKTGQLLKKNEAVEQVAQKTFEKGLRQRTGKVVRAVGEIPGQMEGLKQAKAEQVEVLNQINAEREQLTALLSEIAANDSPRDQLAA